MSVARYKAALDFIHFIEGEFPQCLESVRSVLEKQAADEAAAVAAVAAAAEEGKEAEASEEKEAAAEEKDGGERPKSPGARNDII